MSTFLSVAHVLHGQLVSSQGLQVLQSRIAQHSAGSAVCTLEGMLAVASCLTFSAVTSSTETSSLSEAAVLSLLNVALLQYAQHILAQSPARDMLHALQAKGGQSEQAQLITVGRCRAMYAMKNTTESCCLA